MMRAIIWIWIKIRESPNRSKRCFNPPTIGGVMCASLCVHVYWRYAILTHLRVFRGDNSDNHLEFDPARKDANWSTIAALLGSLEADLVDIDIMGFMCYHFENRWGIRSQISRLSCHKSEQSW